MDAGKIQPPTLTRRTSTALSSAAVLLAREVATRAAAPAPHAVELPSSRSDARQVSSLGNAATRSLVIAPRSRIELAIERRSENSSSS